MLTFPRKQTTVVRLQALLKEFFRARDDLCLVAEDLEDRDESEVCRWLADRFGGHAADLQQIIIANCAVPVAPESALHATKPSVEDLVERYDSVIENLDDQEVAALLGTQRKEAMFADRVLRLVLEHSARHGVFLDKPK